MIKKKLNSSNPRYKKADKEAKNVDRRFIKEIKGVKIYALY